MSLPIKFVLPGLLALAMVSVGCNQDRAIAVDHLNKGVQSYQAGESMTAIKELKLARDQDPTYAEPALFLGDIYYQRVNNLVEAEASYREAIKRDPENIDAYYKLGAVLFDKGDASQAVAAFQQVVQKDETHAKAWFRMGLSQAAIGSYPEAVESYMKSIRANPRMKIDKDDPGGAAYHALGDLYARFSFYDKSLAVYENGILNNQESSQLYAGRGMAEQSLKRPADAEKSLEKALEMDPQNVAATFNLAVAKHSLGQKDGAIKVLENFLNRASDPARRQAAQGLLQSLRTTDSEVAQQ
ncbi:tetratricopeptide repeat protein [Bradymonas sediminis]|nr:tetratricopeptide repeat protein [Bradymonas sediminis]